MNVRCDCGHYYNIDIYDNICPECDKTYEYKNKESGIETQYVDIDKHFEKLSMLNNFYKGGKLDFK